MRPVQQRAVAEEPADVADDEPPQAHRGAPPRRRLRSRFFPDLLVVVALVACVVAFFWPLLQGRMYSVAPSAQQGILPWAVQRVDYPRAVQDDQAVLSFPWQIFTTDTVRQGSLPFWDPHDFGGYPFLTNGSAGVLNPVRLALALTVNPVRAHELFSIFFLLAGGIFAYLLARDLGLRRWGGSLAAVAWMLSGWNLGWLHLEVVSPVIGLFPLGLLTVGRAVGRRRLGWTVLAAASLAWVLLSAHLLFGIVTFTICVIYGGVLAVSPLLRRQAGPRTAPAGQRLLRLAAVTAGSLMLAAPMLLPTFLALQESPRTRDPYAVFKKIWLAKPQWFLTTFVPAKLPLDYMILNYRLAFAGTATALLALVGLWSWRRLAVRLGAGLVAVIFLVAVGTPFTWLAYHVIPGMNVFRPYSRLMMWWPMGIALIAGTGLDWLVGRVSASTGPAAASSEGLGSATRRDRRRRWLASAIALVVVTATAVQLLNYGRESNPPFPERTSQNLFPDTALLAAMRTPGTSVDQWPARSLGIAASQEVQWSQKVLYANSAIIAGLDSMAGYDSTVPARQSEIVRVLTGENPGVVLAKGLEASYAPSFDIHSRLDLLPRVGVSQLALAPSLGLGDVWAEPLRRMGGYERYHGKEGVFVQLPPNGPRLVGGTQTVEGRVEAFHTFLSPQFDHTASVLLEPDQRARLDSQPLPSQNGPAGQIVEATRSTNYGRLVVEADRPAWLLIPESWDAGWSARVNGHSTPVLQADYYQRAVLVPAGRSEVTLKYRPRGWTAGVGIFFLSVAGCATTAGALWLRRRRSDRSRPAAA